MRFVWLLAILVVSCLVAAADEYGPPNMLKTLRNPFMGGQGGDSTGGSAAYVLDSPISIDGTDARTYSLSRRFAAPLLYMPGRLTMGKSAEFIVKGKPGYYAALAMADRDSGAKPIHGHAIHLGPDRKVIEVGKIPDNGLLHLWIEAPFEGDLVGLPLFFEAAVWSKSDFSDLQMAVPVKSEGTQTAGNFGNGVIMAASEDMIKKDPFVVHESPQTSAQHMQYTGSHLDSGRP